MSLHTGHMLIPPVVLRVTRAIGGVSQLLKEGVVLCVGFCPCSPDGGQHW